MAVDELVLGRPARVRKLARRLPVARLRRAVVALAVVVLAPLALTVATSRGWAAPAPVPPLGAQQPRALSAWQLHLPYAAVDETDTVVVSRGHRLDARILTPVGAPTGIPGVVLVGGDHAGRADDLRAEAEAFARGGVGTLVYDRPPTWWPVGRDDDDRAADALAAADNLAARSEVDPRRVGLVGLDEGGWAVSLAAERAAGQVPFVVLAGAPVVTPAQRTAWRVDQALSAAPTLVRRAAAVAVASADASSGDGDGDPTSALARAGVPVFAVWGAQDRTVPVAAAATRLRSLLGDRASVEVVAGAGHRLAPVTDGWTDDVSDWVRRGQSADVAVRGVEPASAAGLAEPPTIGAWGDLRIVLGLGVLAALGAALTPARRRTPVSRRAAGRAGSPPPRPPR